MPRSKKTDLSSDHTLREVEDLCRTHVPGTSVNSSESFVLTPSDKSVPPFGLTVRGQYRDGASLISWPLILVPTENPALDSQVFRELEALKLPIQMSEQPGQGIEIFATLKVARGPLDYGRLGGLASKMQALLSSSSTLKALLSSPGIRPHERGKLFEGLSKVVNPVAALSLSDFPSLDMRLQSLGDKVVDYLLSGLSVALVGDDPLHIQLVLAVIAGLLEDDGLALGRLAAASVTAKELPGLVTMAKAPIAVSANGLRQVSSLYEVANDSNTMLSALAETGHGVLFFGPQEAQRAMFHGGQGGAADPMKPLVEVLPPNLIALDDAVGFSLHQQAQAFGGLPRRVELTLETQIYEALVAGDHGAGAKGQVISAAVRRVVQQWRSGKTHSAENLAGFVRQLQDQATTLSGALPSVIENGLSQARKKFVDRLKEGSLRDRLRASLVGQDNALDQVDQRLQVEALTRSDRQPLRYCAQGLPGNGKSETCGIIASHLGVPCDQIDAAAFADYHTFFSQLFGSGRGVVGSYLAGRLETMAKHPAGMVVEVADICHAPPHLRSQIADTFLNILETGMARAASGAPFSCTNLIFVFTFNLADGADEKLYESMGFARPPSLCDQEETVLREFKKLTSSAFVSRVGAPILFRPLSRCALGTIVERTIAAAVTTATERLDCPCANTILQDGLGEKIVTTAPPQGAREWIAKARTIAVNAVINAHHRKTLFPGHEASITLKSSHRLELVLSAEPLELNMSPIKEIKHGYLSH